MPASCANPLCSTPFRRLAEGKLFRLGTDAPIVSSKVRREDYFWLCDRCSLVMTLRLKQDGTVGPVLFLEAIRGVPAPATLTLAHPQRGSVVLTLIYQYQRSRRSSQKVVEKQIRMPMSEGLQVIPRELVGTHRLWQQSCFDGTMKENHRSCSRLQPVKQCDQRKVPLRSKHPSGNYLYRPRHSAPGMGAKLTAWRKTKAPQTFSSHGRLD